MPLTARTDVIRSRHDPGKREYFVLVVLCCHLLVFYLYYVERSFSHINKPSPDLYVAQQPIYKPYKHLLLIISLAVSVYTPATNLIDGMK